MKKLVRLTVIGVLVLMCALAFAACSQLQTKLAVPGNLRVEQRVIKWNSVPNAENYTVMIDLEEYTSASIQYAIPINKSGDLVIKVRANGNGLNYTASDWAETTVTLSVVVKLPTPSGLKVKDGVLEWVEINNASNYLIKIDDNEISIDTNEYPLSLEVGSYQLSVKAVGDDISYQASEYCPTITYKSYGQLSGTGGSTNGAFGAFDDLSKYESYLGYGFDVIRSNEFSSKTVKISNALFNTDKLLEQRLLKVSENRSAVNVLSGSTMEQFMESWNAGLNVNVQWGGKSIGGSVDVSAKLQKGSEERQSQYFYALDIYNQSHYLVLQSDLDTYRDILSNSFKKDLYDVSISPSVLFDRYGTHFITSAVMGGRLTSYYNMSATETKDYLSLSAKVDVQVRYLAGKTSVGAEVNYRQDASSEGIHITNTLSIIGGGNFGMLSDADIRDNYGDWEKSLQEKPALMGIKDASSLWQIWDLIDSELDNEAKFSYLDKNNVQQFGTRSEQLQAYFYEYGLDAYNSLMDMYDIRTLTPAESIANIRVNNEDPVDGFYVANAGTTAQISFMVLPTDALYTTSYSLLDNTYASINNSGQITINSIAPNNTILEVTLGAGAIRETIKIRVKRVYTVFFECNNGSTIRPITGINEGSTIASPDNPTLTYYAFSGWYSDSNFINEFIFFSTPVTSNLTLYAKWTPIEYGVTFEANGDNSVAPIYTSILKGFKITAPSDPVKTGYTFDGWYKEKLLSNLFDFENDTVSANMTLYAKWSPDKHTVTYFKTIDDTITYAVYASRDYDSVIPTPADPQLGGKVFAGWFKDKLYINPLLANDLIKGDVILYGRWSVEIKTVTFVANVPDVSNIVDSTYESGDTLRVPNLIWEGHTFIGWFRDSDCSDKWLSSDKIDDDITLYAEWKVNRYSISFDKNTGVGQMLSIEYNYGEAKALPKNSFTKIGYEFFGWNIEKDGIGKQFNDEEIVVNLSLSDNVAVILYAQWRVCVYTITYRDVGDAEFSGMHGLGYPTSHEYGKATVLVNPTKNNYAFVGWYKNIVGTGVAVNSLSAQEYTENIILYAKFVSTTFTGISEYNSAEAAQIENCTLDLKNYNFTGNTLLTIKANTKRIEIIGKSAVINNFKIGLQARSTDLEIVLNGLKWKSYSGAALDVFISGSARLTLNILGANEIYGLAGDTGQASQAGQAGQIGINAGDIKIIGSGSLSVTGGSGGNGGGQSISRRDGCAGGIGGAAINCWNLELDSTGNITIIGGTGGTGGITGYGGSGNTSAGTKNFLTAGSGGAGGNGVTATGNVVINGSKGVVIITGGVGGVGGSGRNGSDGNSSTGGLAGNGGVGGKGGVGISAMGLVTLKSVTVKGGAGGAGGKGGNGWETGSWFSHESDGANGGKGGDGGNAIFMTNTSTYTNQGNVTLAGGAGGTGGARGEGAKWGLATGDSGTKGGVGSSGQKGV